MAEFADLKPCLVSTTQGFSISYKQKLLYSKYNPSKTILNTINGLSILPGTIILCCSPVLDYGIKELYDKLPENCLLFGCEPEPELNKYISENSQQLDKIILLNNEEFYHLPEIINYKNYTFNNGRKIEFSGNFKRVIRLDFSGGTQFNSKLFDYFFDMTSNAIKTFWTNRITLTHFGRRYSKNFFQNLNNLKSTVPVCEYFQAVKKPIIVCGAGQSLEKLFSDNLEYSDFFILCADTALKPLISHNIVPNGVFIDEAQHVISKAFIGTQDYKYHLFASLCSLPQLTKQIPSKRISYYNTIFTESNFIKQHIINSAFPTAITPFGSVGLTSLYFATKFRADISIPIYIYGLDFSYSAGYTHARQTLAHETRLYNANRLTSIQNYAAAYCSPAYPIKDKNNNLFFTTPILKSYCDLLTSFFSDYKNIYDSSDCGIELNLPRKVPETLNNISEIKEMNLYKENDLFTINKYLEDERIALAEIKDILTGKKNLSQTDSLEYIKKAVENREYLFLHFPDGYKFNTSQNFLNRIRVEIDYFLKYI